MDFDATAYRCAPYVAAATARALVRAESDMQPWAIHVSGARLDRQPRTQAEAIVTAAALRAAGWDFDAGLAQINVRNIDRLGVPLERVFDPCTNLGLMQRILGECYWRARQSDCCEQRALREALSCYNAGSLREGLRNGYVARVVHAAGIETSRLRGEIRQSTVFFAGRQIIQEGSKK
ncbi:Transglycosylase family protein [Burkholderiales bacterium]|nr:Transglycosylase family protein [Burkholderiales bacterium]